MGEQLQLEDEEVSITLRRAWDRALRGLATRVNKPTFEAHIRTLKPVSLTEEAPERGGPAIYVITLGVPSAFTREWVEKRHGTLIQSLLEEILDRDVRVRFAITPREKASAAPAPARTLNLFAENAPENDEGPGPASSAAPRPSVGPVLPTAGASAKAAAPRSSARSAAASAAAVATDGDLFESLAETEPVAAKSPARTTNPAATPDIPKSVPAGRTEPARSPGEARRPMPAPQPQGGSGSGNQADAPALNSRYTFETFVTGPSNRMAHAGAKAVAQSPGQVYNPLFLYGPSGLGKTHLMHAIGNEILQERGLDPRRVAYVSGEAFTSHFITSLRQQRTEEFRRKWRFVDLWLVDDIQFIAGTGKEHTKEEFFHTFNALYQMGKQIVISSDRSPRELRMMDERLRSRFEGGLTVDIAPPDLETRLAILHRKAENEGMRIPDEVLLYMARLVQSNIRTLEGALVKLVAYASVVNSPVTTELASSILERYYIAAGFGAEGGNGPSVGSDPAGAVAAALGKANGSRMGGRIPYSETVAGLTPELVQRVVARRFGLPTDALTGKKRDRDVVTARQVAMHLMRELTEMSLPGIGQIFGGRDHTTVLHACDRVKSQIPIDDDLRGLVEDLTTQLRAQAAG